MSKDWEDGWEDSSNSLTEWEDAPNLSKELLEKGKQLGAGVTGAYTGLVDTVYGAGKFLAGIPFKAGALLSGASPTDVDKYLSQEIEENLGSFATNLEKMGVPKEFASESPGYQAMMYPWEKLTEAMRYPGEKLKEVGQEELGAGTNLAIEGALAFLPFKGRVGKSPQPKIPETFKGYPGKETPITSKDRVNVLFEETAKEVEASKVTETDSLPKLIEEPARLDLLERTPAEETPLPIIPQEGLPVGRGPRDIPIKPQELPQERSPLTADQYFERAAPETKVVGEPPRTPFLELTELQERVPDTQRLATRHDVPTIDFPLRQEVLERPEIKEAIDSFRIRESELLTQIDSLKKDPLLDKQLQKETLGELTKQVETLREEFGRGMELLGIKEPSDAYGRALYEPTAKSLPIEKTKSGFDFSKEGTKKPIGGVGKKGRKQGGAIDLSVFIPKHLIKDASDSIKLLLNKTPAISKYLENLVSKNQELKAALLEQALYYYNISNPLYGRQALWDKYTEKKKTTTSGDISFGFVKETPLQQAIKKINLTNIKPILKEIEMLYENYIQDFYGGEFKTFGDLYRHNPKEAVSFLEQRVFDPLFEIAEKLSDAIKKQEDSRGSKLLEQFNIAGTSKGLKERGGYIPKKEPLLDENTFKSLGKEKGYSEEVINKAWGKYQKENNITPTVDIYNGSSKMDAVTKDNKGLQKLMKDFTPDLRPWEEVRKEMFGVQDIPDTVLSEQIKQNLMPPKLYSLAKENPFIKYGMDRIEGALNRAREQWTQALYNKESGVVSNWNRVSKEGKIKLNDILQKFEGERYLTPEELKLEGLSPQEIKTYEALKQVTTNAIDTLNEMRLEKGLEPVKPREGYFPSYFIGDWYFEVYKKGSDGKLGQMLYRPTGDFKGIAGRGGLESIRKQMSKEHPEWIISDIKKRPEFNKEFRDAEAGYQQILEMLEPSMPETAVVREAFRNTREALAHKQAGFKGHLETKFGVGGYEGNKYWRSSKKNAEDAMHSFVKYTEQVHSYIEFQRTATDISKMLRDARDTASPNYLNLERAANYVEFHWNTSRGMYKNAIEGLDIIPNKIAEAFGLSDKAIQSAIRETKKYLTLSWLGFFRPGFLFSQKIQPAQVLPAWSQTLRTKYGMEIPGEAFVKAGLDSNTLSMFGKGSVEGKAAYDYAIKKGYLEAHFTDEVQSASALHGNQLVSYAMGEKAILFFEKESRLNAYLTFVNTLKDAGMKVGPELYDTAFQLTNVSMVDYRLHQRAPIYSRLGHLGEIASGLTTFKHNNYSQLALFGKEAFRGNPAALTVFLSTAVIIGGLSGLYGREDLQVIWRGLQEANLIPADAPSPNELIANHVPNYLSYGEISGITGLDISPLFNPPGLLASGSPMDVLPIAKKAGEMLGTGASVVLKGINPEKENTNQDWREFVHSWRPTSFGVAEDIANTKNGVVLNPNTGLGQFKRGEFDISNRDWQARMMGMYSTKESRQRTAERENKVTTAMQTTKRGELLKEMKNLNESGKSLRDLPQKFIRYGGNPNEVGDAVLKHKIEQALTETQRKEIESKSSMAGVKELQRLQQYKGLAK